jgi:hypothetical protein
MYPDPVTQAEWIAHHLELNYGLQLDPARRATLLADLETLLVSEKPEKGDTDAA